MSDFIFFQLFHLDFQEQQQKKMPNLIDQDGNTYHLIQPNQYILNPAFKCEVVDSEQAEGEEIIETLDEQSEY